MNKKAFSLVELSIVLIIIGLLVTGVSGGQKLIHSAKINKTLAELENIIASVNTFKATYDALPGDFNNASNFFGSSACEDHATFSDLTCNGDGNDAIGSIYAADGKVGESPYVYLHMSLAEIYPGNFESSPNSSDTLYAGVNDENSAFFNLEKKGYYAFWGGAGTNKARIYLGARYEGSTSSNVGKPYAPAFTGATGYKIDKKIDDGNLASGKVLIILAASDESISCNKSSSSIGCHSIIKIDP